jgi:hypothetical protein
MSAIKVTLDDTARKAASAISCQPGFAPAHHLTEQLQQTDWTSDLEALTFGEVVAVGPGRAAIVDDRPEIEPGNIVAFKRRRIAHDLARHDSDGTRNDLMVHEHGIVLRYDDGPGSLGTPLSNWVMTKRDPEAFRRIIGRHSELTDRELGDGVTTKTHQVATNPGLAGTRWETKPDTVATRGGIVFERVVAAGPGRFVRTIVPHTSWYGPGTHPMPAVVGAKRRTWEPVAVNVGQMIGLYRMSSSIKFRQHGVHYSLTEWDECICAVEED